MSNNNIFAPEHCPAADLGAGVCRRRHLSSRRADRGGRLPSLFLFLFQVSAQVKSCASRGPWDGALNKKERGVEGKHNAQWPHSECATSAQ